MFANAQNVQARTALPVAGHRAPAAALVRRWLFPLALLALFVPMPRLGLPVSPENLIYLSFLVLVFAGTLPGGLRMPRPVRLLGALAVVFMVAQFVIKGWFFGEPIAEPMLVRRVLLLAMACTAIRDRPSFQGAAVCVIFGVLVSGIVGLFTVFQIEPVASLFNRFLEVGVEDLDVLDRRSDLATKRLMGLRGSVYGFSYLTAPAYLLLCGLVADALRRRATGRVAACLVAMGLVLACMLLNAERSAFLALAIGLVHLVFAIRRADVTLVALAPLAAGLLGLFAWNDLLLSRQDDAQNNFLQRIENHDNGEVEGRIGLALGGALTVLEHPLTGGSQEDYQRTAGSLRLVSGFFMNKGLLPASHNSYVNAGMRAGVLGWILLAGMLVFALRITRQATRASRIAGSADPVAIAVHAGVLACLVNALFHNQGLLSGEPMTWAVLALGAGALAMYRPHPAAPGGPAR